MKNTKTVLDRMEQIIETENCYKNPAPAARDAVKQIDERYIVIQRNGLPKVEEVHQITRYSNNYTAQVGGVTDQNSDPEFHRKRAAEHLAMASYLTEQKDVEKKKLDEDRKKVWAELYPDGDPNVYQWDSLFMSTQRAITKILSLQSALRGPNF